MKSKKTMFLKIGIISMFWYCALQHILFFCLVRFYIYSFFLLAQMFENILFELMC